MFGTEEEERKKRSAKEVKRGKAGGLGAGILWKTVV